MRRLEEAGIRNLEDLASSQVADLIQMGLRRDLAEQVQAYVLEEVPSESF